MTNNLIKRYKRTRERGLGFFFLPAKGNVDLVFFFFFLPVRGNVDLVFFFFSSF